MSYNPNKIKKIILMGVQGENLANFIEFDMSRWHEEWPNALYVILLQRPGESSAYDVVTEYNSETHILTWKVRNVDTAIEGDAQAEIVAIQSDNEDYAYSTAAEILARNAEVVKKSLIFDVTIEPCLNPPGEIPDPYEDWYLRMIQVEANTKQYRDQAEQYKDDAYAYCTAAEVAARNAEQYASDIEDLTVSAHELPSGSQPTVEKTKPEGQPYNLNFGIPKGDTGEVGPQGPVGPQGERGSNWFSSTTNPSSVEEYQVNDLWFNTTSNNIFQLVSGTPNYWQLIGNIKGAQGPIGPTGPMGPQGIQGPKGDTGNGILSIEKTGTSGSVDTYTITFTDGSTTTFDVTNGEVTYSYLNEVLDDYADKDYVDKKDTNLQYEIADLKAKLYETVVGVKQLKTEYASEIDIPTHITEDSVAYPVLDNTAMEAANIKGHSVVWNKISRSVNRTVAGITITTTNGKYSFTGTTTATYFGFDSVKSIAGHWYLVAMLEIVNPNSIALRYGDFNDSPRATSSQPIVISRAYNSGTHAVGMEGYGGSGIDFTGVSFRAIYVDLTQIFGAGNEPTTLDDNKTKWAIDYATKHPEYDAGSLKNVNVEKLESYTANVWDEEYIPTGYILNNGVVVENYVNRFASKNFTRIFPNTPYYFKLPYVLSGWGVRIGWYDANKSVIRVADYYPANNIITSPSNAIYMKFNVHDIYGSSAYNHDISIYKGSTDLGYIPYKKLGSLTLPNIDLRGVNDIQDTLEFVEQENGTYNLEHTKYVGRVDLEDIVFTWDGSRWYANASSLGIKLPSSNNDKANLTSSKYFVYAINAMAIDSSKIGIGVATNGNIYVYNNDSTNQPTGILNFELATPVKTVIATSLLFDEVSLLINKYGRIEVVNRSTDNVNADTTFNVAVKEFKDNE